MFSHRLCKDAVGRLGIFMLFFLFTLSLRLVCERRRWWSAGAMRLLFDSFTGLQSSMVFFVELCCMDEGLWFRLQGMFGDMYP